MSPEPKKYSYTALGTTWHVSVWDESDPADFSRICEVILRKSQEFDQVYSRFIKTSLVWSLATQTGVVAVPPDFMYMLCWYFRLYEPSGHMLNPLIGFTISDLGYDADYSLIPKRNIRSTPNLRETVRIVDDGHIEISEPVLFDFGALGKGYLVDALATLLREHDYRRFLVDGSGDIAYSGSGVTIRVGLEHPGDAKKVIGVAQMTGGAMCASATNRRAWGNVHHIINPLTKTSPKDILAVWVIAESAVLADALASCLFFVAPEHLGAFAFSYCILNSKYRARCSPDFPAELFVKPTAPPGS